MQNSNKPQNPIVFIVGPTATGKSELAATVAGATGAGIVNCDSVQVYKGLNIGSAKPSEAERQRLPHYLYDFLTLEKAYTAGEFRRDAIKVIDAHLGERPLIFVGGSGFYFLAIEKGMYDSGPVSEEVVQKTKALMEEQGVQAAYDQLMTLDPEHAAKISSNDSYRIHRALCVIGSTGQSVSSIKSEFAKTQVTLGDQYPLIKVGLKMDRTQLRERVRARVQKMLQAGLVQETQKLVAECGSDCGPLSSVGYREVCQFLAGQLQEPELVEEITKNTMRLAKRQMTWFKRDPEITWYDALEDREKAHRELVSRIKDR